MSLVERDYMRPGWERYNKNQRWDEINIMEKKLWAATKLGFVYWLGFIFGMEQYTTDYKDFDMLGSLIASAFFLMGFVWMILYILLFIKRRIGNRYLSN